MKITTKLTTKTPLNSTEIKSRLIFDQYSRYLPTAKVIQSVLGSDESEILDIGSGDECILGQLLPEHLFTFIDPLLIGKAAISKNHQYIAGDIFCEELEEKQFSVVCTVDVLEHIPADFRERFLTKIADLATDLVVLSFPCQELDSGMLDEHMNQVYSSVFGKNYPWLDEHFKYGLPSSTEVESFFEARGWHTYCFGHGHLPWLEEFLTFSLGALDIPVLRNIVFTFSREFNEIAVDADICPPCYRRVFIASKKEVGSQLNEIFSYEKYQEELQGITEQLKEKFYSGVLKECRTQSELINALKVQKQELADKLTLLQGQQAPVAQVNSSKMVVEKKLSEFSLTAQSTKANVLQRVQSEQGDDSAELQDSLSREKLLGLELLKLQEKTARLEQNIDSLLETQSELNTVLEREKVSLVKPVLRRLFRFARRIFHLMPSRVQSVIRAVKNRVMPRLRRVFSYSFKSERVLRKQRIQSLAKILSCKREGYDVLVFPVIDWHFRIQRPQHIAAGLAQNGHRVFYFSPVFGAADPSVTLSEQIDDRVFLCQLNLPAS
ncbi:MAG: hypothetical protein ABIK07_00265, partial [Planctomycetota bacterium]